MARKQVILAHWRRIAVALAIVAIGAGVLAYKIDRYTLSARVKWEVCRVEMLKGLYQDSCYTETLINPTEAQISMAIENDSVSFVELNEAGMKAGVFKAMVHNNMTDRDASEVTARMAVQIDGKMQELVAGGVVKDGEFRIAPGESKEVMFLARFPDNTPSGVNAAISETLWAVDFTPLLKR